MACIVFGCRAAGVDMPKQVTTTQQPEQKTASDQDPTLVAYGDLKSFVESTIRNTQTVNDLWPSVVTNGIQTLCVLVAVLWFIRRHSYRAGKPL